MKDYILELPKPIEFFNCRNISKYTKPELNRFRELCNFTEDELCFFNLRSKGESIVAISLSMYISESKVHDIRRRVESKMLRVS